MACCESKVNFLKEKASNFRTYLKQNSKNPEVEALLDQYTEENVVPLVSTYLIPLFATNQLDVAVKAVTDACQNEAPEFVGKVKRYLQCFAETLVS